MDGECFRDIVPSKLPRPISCQALITSLENVVSFSGSQALDLYSTAVLGPYVPEPIQAQIDCLCLMLRSVKI